MPFRRIVGIERQKEEGLHIRRLEDLLTAEGGRVILRKEAVAEV